MLLAGAVVLVLAIALPVGLATTTSKPVKPKGIKGSLSGAGIEFITDRDFDPALIESDVPIVAEFWANWASTCRYVSPTIEKLARYYEGRVRFCRIDVETEEALARRYGVNSVPVFAILRDGRLVDKFGMLPSEKEYRDRIEKLLRASQ